jgi:hypothetical protein
MVDQILYAENTQFLISTKSSNRHISSQIHGGLVFISKSKIQFESKSPTSYSFNLKPVGFRIFFQQ